MKKSRNSFFSESNFQAYNPNMNMQPNNGGAPFQTASNYFYQGPMPNNYNTMPSGSDIESRLAKIERQINRIEYRLKNIENSNNIITSEDFENNTTNMYML